MIITKHNRWLWVVIILWTPMLWGQVTDYYVSPAGNDENPGTLNQPFRTIQRAVDKMASGDVCFLREGRYHKHIIIHDRSDLTFKAYPGEHPILDGSVRLTPNWVIHKDAIYKAILSEDIWQLFVDHEEMVMARWPNASFNDGTVWDRENHWGHGDKDAVSNGLMVDAPHGQVDLAASGIDMTGATAILNIGSWMTWARKIKSHQGNRFTYAPLANPNQFKPNHQYYYLEGKLNLLDTEQEWFYDLATKTLYIWAAYGMHPGTLSIRGKTQTYSFDVSNSQNIKIFGLKFFATTFRFDDCTDMEVESCAFLYPSCSKRMLGNTDNPEPTLIDGNSSRCTIRKCLFHYTDGMALDVHGENHLIENCDFYHIDYSCASLPYSQFSVALTQSYYSIFRRDTIHKTGASSAVNPGKGSALVELNDIYDTGYLQNDGALIHCYRTQADGITLRYNWVHDSPKWALRFDSPWTAPENYGINGTMHHNVSWNTKGLCVKGDSHHIYNNTSLNIGVLSENNGINVIAGDQPGASPGYNENSVTRNNAADEISGSRTGWHDIPGIHDHNWNGYREDGEMTGQLLSPPQYGRLEDYNPEALDFRPFPGSALVNAGVEIQDVTNGYAGNAPDLGAYESEGENWKPGITWDVDSALAVFFVALKTDSNPVDAEHGSIPFSLHQNFPNPFNSSTAIHYCLPVNGHIRLTIRDVLGRTIRQLVDEKQTAGDKVAIWHGIDFTGQPVSSGLYFYCLESDSFHAEKKCLLLR